jgi:hypothetical protein
VNNLEAIKDVFGHDPHIVNYGQAGEDGIYVYYRKKPIDFDYLKNITSVAGTPVTVRFMGPMAPLGGEP